MRWAPTLPTASSLLFFPSRIVVKDRRIAGLAIVVVVLVLIATTVSTYIFARIQFRQEQTHLLEAVTARVTLLRVMAEHEVRESTGYPGEAAAATLALLREATDRFSGFGETGEFTVAHRVGDDIMFVVRLRFSGPEPGLLVPMDAALAEPMRRALEGGTGTMIGADYRGERVVAAYAPVPSLGVGIVAKSDVAEVLQPVIVAGVGLGGLAIVLSVLGMVGVAWVGDLLRRETRSAEETARRLSERLGLALEAGRQGVFDHDYRTGRVTVSPEFCGLLGYAPGELEESFEAWKERLHPEDRDRAVRVYEDHLAGKLDLYRVEARQRRKDGTWVWILSLARVVERDDTGAPLRMVGTYTDITTQKELERALSESEARFRILAETAPVGIFLDDAEGSAVYINPTCADIIGVPAEEALGCDWVPLIHPDDRERVVREWGKAVASGRVFSQEYRWVHPDGQVMWTQGLVAPVKDEGGSVSHFVGCLVDVTERTRMVEQLEEREARLRAVQRMAGVGFLDWDLATDRIFLSEEVLRLYKLDPEQPLTTPELIARSVHQGDLDIVRQGLDLAVRGVEPFNLDHRVVLDDGRTIWVHAQADLIRDADGRPVRLLGTVVDVTARKEAERVLEAQQEELETRVAERTAELAAANRELEAFTYSVSHDLKAPLRAIDANSAFLAERAGSLDPQAAALVDEVRSQTRRMSELLDDLLVLSRSGRQELRREPVDLDQLMRDAFQHERARIPDRTMELRLAALPPVMGDLSLLNQVVQNLVGNAVKFTGTRDAAVIEVDLVEGDDGPVFRIRDNGVGFDMAHAEKLFMPFRRLHYEDEFPGTGVGLAIVQRIVERHGGRVWAEGEPDNGATVYLMLPLAEEAV